MTVAELLAELSKLDPQTRVLVEGYEFGLTDPNIVYGKVGLDVNAGLPHSGQHAQVNEDDWLVYDARQRGKTVNVVDAVILTRRSL